MSVWTDEEAVLALKQAKAFVAGELETLVWLEQEAADLEREVGLLDEDVTYLRWDISHGRLDGVSEERPLGTLTPELHEELKVSPGAIARIRNAFAGGFRRALRVMTLEELRAGGESFDPVVPNLAFRGLKTMIVGLSKAGKSWMVWSKCADAVGAGLSILYLSEEPSATVADKVRVFGLEEAYEAGTFLVSRRALDEVRNLKWPEVCKRLADDVRATGVDLVVVDTFRPWVNLAGDEGSNSADAIGPAMDALSPVCDAGAAVIVIHQAGWAGKRARGSTELHATSDLIFHVEGKGSEARTITYVGGRVDKLPNTQTFRWAGGVGEDLGKMRHDKAERISELLQLLEDTKEPLSAETIADTLDRNLRSVQRWLEELEKTGKVIRHPGEHTGTKVEPDLWTRGGVIAQLLAGIKADQELA